MSGRWMSFLKQPFMLSLGLSLLVALWMLSGVLSDSPADQAPEATGLAAAPRAPMRVLVIASEARPVADEVIVQGQIEPWRRVTLRAETEGRVVALPVDKGAWVEAGAVLVELAEDDRPAQLARARAEVAARELELTAAETLGQQGMQARTQIKHTQAALAGARAELARLELDLERIAIRAPFAGQVEAREVELGSLLQRGDAVLELVDHARLKAVAQVPQQRAGALALDQPVRVWLLDGSETEGRLIFLSRVADPRTRGFRVEAELANPQRRLAAGYSARLRIGVGETRGHFLSPAVLTLNDQGEVGVRTLDDADRVQFVPVRLLRTGLDGVWVSGLAQRARIITRGQGFVGDGERVDPVSDTPAS